VVRPRRRNSERKLDQALAEDAEETEEKGILEIFPRDEDAPLTRDGDDDEDQEPPRRRR
jgi:hypothetical protein